MNTVKGSARKGFRNTHGKKALPSGARSPDSVPGGTAGGGTGKGAAQSNLKGSGNAGLSGTS